MVNSIVSVIIPAYNCCKYIDKAINSVLDQRVPCEIIVIDDCSQDNLEQSIRKYSEMNNIFYYKNDGNIGVSATRNKGVEVAKGKYIAFLDADDWWAPDKLDKQIKFMQDKECIISYTARELYDEEGYTTGKIIHVEKETNYKKLLHHNCIACSSVVILRRVAIECPMKHSEIHEDYLTWLTILERYGTAYGIDEPLLKYRLTQNGKSRNKLKSVRMTYGVYKKLEINNFKALVYTCSHVVHGIKKYYI